MQELMTLSVGIGLVVSLIFAELLGMAAGGMVVPGYVALSLDHPEHLILTLIASVASWLSVHVAGTVVVIYGRRRTVLMLLTGFLIGALLRRFGGMDLGPLGKLDLSVVGYIIPGLIAIWIDRQGLVKTVAALITASVIVRLLLVLITGGEMSL